MKTKFAIGFTILLVIVGSIFYVTNQSKTATTLGKVKDKIMAVANNTKPNSGNPPAGQNKETKPGAAAPKLTAEENKLKEKYNAKFQEINTVADKKLDSLIAQAQKEEKYKKENHMDTGRITEKYVAVLDAYEKQTKTQFATLYKQLQDEAKESIVGQVFQNEFQIKKAERNQKFKQELKKLS